MKKKRPNPLILKLMQAEHDKLEAEILDLCNKPIKGRVLRSKRAADGELEFYIEYIN